MEGLKDIVADSQFWFMTVQHRLFLPFITFMIRSQRYFLSSKDLDHIEDRHFNASAANYKFLKEIMLSTLRPEFVKQTVQNFMSHFQVSEKYLAIHWRYSRTRFIHNWYFSCLFFGIRLITDKLTNRMQEVTGSIIAIMKLFVEQLVALQICW